MQKNTKWYDLRQVKEGYSIYFSFSIRIQAIFLLFFCLIIMYFQVFEEVKKVNILAIIIFGTIGILSIIFSLFIDSFFVLVKESKIIRKIGIYPFVIKKDILFSEINSFSTEILEKQRTNYNYRQKENIPEGYYSGKIKEYLLSIELKNGKEYKIAFGKGDEKLFNKFIEELKKFL